MLILLSFRALVKESQMIRNKDEFDDKKLHESLFAYEKLKYEILEESYLSIILFFLGLYGC
jgi:hypothetical protein